MDERAQIIIRDEEEGRGDFDIEIRFPAKGVGSGQYQRAVYARISGRGYDEDETLEEVIAWVKEHVATHFTDPIVKVRHPKYDYVDVS